MSNSFKHLAAKGSLRGSVFTTYQLWAGFQLLEGVSLPKFANVSRVKSLRFWLRVSAKPLEF